MYGAPFVTYLCVHTHTHMYTVPGTGYLYNTCIFFINAEGTHMRMLLKKL